MTAASSPTRGPTTTRGSRGACLSRMDCNTSAGSFPSGRRGIAPVVYRGAAAPHRGVRAERERRPRIGALDVLPFVPLAGATMAEAVALAHDTGRALAARHALPVYYYGHAARRPERRAP